MSKHLAVVVGFFFPRMFYDWRNEWFTKTWSAAKNALVSSSSTGRCSSSSSNSNSSSSSSSKCSTSSTAVGVEAATVVEVAVAAVAAVPVDYKDTFWNFRPKGVNAWITTLAVSRRSRRQWGDKVARGASMTSYEETTPRQSPPLTTTKLRP